MIVDDRRTEVEKKTHIYLVGGRDKFMSGWGPAVGGSWAFWACTFEDLDWVEKWVKDRSEIKWFTIRTTIPWKRGRSHVSVYAVTEGHPALKFKPRTNEAAQEEV